MTNPAETPLEPTSEKVEAPATPVIDSSVRATTLDSMPVMDETPKPAAKSPKLLLIIAAIVLLVIVGLLVVLIAVITGPKTSNPTPTPTPTVTDTPVTSVSPTATATITPTTTGTVTPTTALTKTSNAKNSIVSMMVPATWSFEYIDLLESDTESFGFTAKSNSDSQISIVVSNLGRGGPCDGVLEEEGDPCVTTLFHKNSFVEVNNYKQGSSYEIFGSPVEPSEDNNFFLTVTYKDMGTKELSPADKALVVQILDNLQLL